MKPAPLDAEQIARLLRPKPSTEPARKKLTNGVLLNQPLPDHAVRDIRRRWAAGEPLKGIATDHGITRAAVSLIGSGQRHRDVV
jgi:hypothetical protein